MTMHQSEFATTPLPTDWEGEPLRLIGLDLWNGVAILEGYIKIPVIEMRDRFGNLTADPNRAHTFIAGRGNDRWVGNVAPWRLASVH